MAGYGVAAAGPLCARVGENPRLGGNAGLVIERTGRYHGDPTVIDARQRAAADRAENGGKALRFRHFVAAGQGLAGGPGDRIEPQDDIAAMRAAARLAAALAMAVVKAPDLALDLVGDGPAEAAAGNCRLAHVARSLLLDIVLHVPAPGACDQRYRSAILIRPFTRAGVSHRT